MAGAGLAEAALASVAVSDVGLASVVALHSTVDLDPALSPFIAVSGGLASVVALHSTVDSDPALSPFIAVSDVGLASVVDSVAGLASVDLVDGRSNAYAASRSIANSVAATRVSVDRRGGMCWGASAQQHSAPLASLENHSVSHACAGAFIPRSSGGHLGATMPHCCNGNC